MYALFARQEIYNSKGSVCAYELLYRAGDQFRANIDASNEQAGDDATSYVLKHLFTHLDINTIIGPHSAYINFTRNHILQQIPLLLPKKRIIIELLENIPVDELLLENIRTLSSQGYKLALDDFIFRDDLIPLIEIADVIKIEVLHLNKQQIKNQLDALTGFKGKFLAEKIEDRNQLIICQDLGFDYFQGFFLNYPHLIHDEPYSEKKVHLLNLFAELYNSETSMQRVEEIILEIPQLRHRILKLARSVAQDKKINTLIDALQQLGLAKIQDWISLLLISSSEDLAHSLLERTLIRAKMCQVLAKNSGLANPHHAYTVGMLSTLDAILNEPMSLLLDKLQLNNELATALLGRSGQLGYILNMTQAYEQANFGKLEYSNFSGEDYSAAYLQGIEYSNSMMEIIN